MTPRQAAIHDWNLAGDAFDYRAAAVILVDETLRDGLQSPSAVDPPMAAKLRLLHLMAGLGIGVVNLGQPLAGPRAALQVRTLAREIVAARLPLTADCAARTLTGDLEPIARLSQETGLPIRAACFIGASAMRQRAEGWTVDDLLRLTSRAVAFAVREGLEVMFVAEDTTRTPPDTLRALYRCAIAAGARHLCLADTAGHATPGGVHELVRFVRDDVLDGFPERIGIDWHGHRDRGLALANCLAAIAAGVDRVHATALGLGERSGNAEMDLLLVNLRLLGDPRGDPRLLPEYVRAAAESTGTSIPPGYPVFGADAFRTATGVHAAAIAKACSLGDEALAGQLYSAVPAKDFGLRGRISLSALSGHAAVRYWLGANGYDPADRALVDALLAEAKRSDRLLSDEECRTAVAATMSLRGEAHARD